MRSPRGPRRGAIRCTVPAGALALLFFGCGSDREVREWRPEDHQAPPAVAEDGRASPQQLDARSEARIAAALWTTRCARCHGEDGRGRGPGAPPGAPIPDFTAADFHEGRSDAQLAEVVVKGRNMMPAFEGQLMPREIALLVHHVRTFGGATLKGTPDAEPASAPAEAPAEQPPPASDAEEPAAGGD